MDIILYEDYQSAASNLHRDSESPVGNWAAAKPAEGLMGVLVLECTTIDGPSPPRRVTTHLAPRLSFSGMCGKRL